MSPRLKLDELPPKARAQAEAQIVGVMTTNPDGSRDVGAVSKGRWSNATPTTADGIKFPSKVQARVYLRLTGELRPGDRLYREVRFPLLSIAPNDRGIPYYITIDFVIVPGMGTSRYVDAKTARKSREWARGRAAFESTYQARIEEQQ